MARGVTDRVAALVIGGGVSGLVCAHALRKAGVDALCLEASDRPGGSIRTEQRDGYLLELGPQSFTGTAQLLRLFDELGIREKIVQAPTGAPRYVLIGGKLLRVPMSPPAFLTSGFVSLGTKFALLRDVFGKNAPPDSDESIADFTRRKFSVQMLDRLVGPFVSGVYAGDPEKLSLRSAFPMLHDAETRKGSIIRGMLSKAKERKPDQPRQRPTLLNFRDGTQTFTNALAANLNDRFLPNTVVRMIAVDRSGPVPVFQVTVRTGAEQKSVLTDHVIVATPTSVAAILLRGVESTIADRLAEIEYAPVAVVSLAYSKQQIDDPVRRASDSRHCLELLSLSEQGSRGLRSTHQFRRWRNESHGSQTPAGRRSDRGRSQRNRTATRHSRKANIFEHRDVSAGSSPIQPRPQRSPGRNPQGSPESPESLARGQLPARACDWRVR